MASNQELRQASVRAVTSTTLDYNGDWSALFDAASIAGGDFNGRLLGWINGKLGTSYAALPDAMQAFAVNQGFFDWSAMGTFNAASYLPQTLALIAQMSPAPSTARAQLMDACIAGMIADGTWALLDALYFTANFAQQGANLNWVSPTTFTLTTTVAPTWTADLGYAGNGSTQFVNTNYNPATNGTLFLQNSHSMGVYINTTTDTGKTAVGNINNLIDPNLVTGTGVTVRSAVAGNFTPTVASVGAGMVSYSRTASNVLHVLDKNGTIHAGSTASTGLDSHVFYFCAENNTGSLALPTANRIASAWWGGGMTDGQMQAMQTRITTFLTAIGGN